MLTHEIAASLFRYEPDTGHLIRLCRRGGARAGSVAGTAKGHGYVAVEVLRHYYYVHRIAWLLMTGSWPLHEIDHANGISTDNRWCNLRAATRNQNNHNRRLGRNNRCGFKGVWWQKRRKKWYAKIEMGGTCRHLGSFDNAQDAARAYQDAATRVFGEFAKW